MKSEQFICAAVELVITSSGSKRIKSLQNVIDELEIQYARHESLKLPCRDTMYKYLGACISNFERENDVKGLNPFGIFKKYSTVANALSGLMSISQFSYKTIAEDANGFYIGLLTVDRGVEKKVADYLFNSFDEFITSVFVGVGGLMIIFKSANREAEFYNLLTPHNTESE